MRLAAGSLRYDLCFIELVLMKWACRRNALTTAPSLLDELLTVVPEYSWAFSNFRAAQLWISDGTPYLRALVEVHKELRRLEMMAQLVESRAWTGFGGLTRSTGSNNDLESRVPLHLSLSVCIFQSCVHDGLPAVHHNLRMQCLRGKAMICCIFFAIVALWQYSAVNPCHIRSKIPKPRTGSVDQSRSVWLFVCVRVFFFCVRLAFHVSMYHWNQTVGYIQNLSKSRKWKWCGTLPLILVSLL